MSRTRQSWRGYQPVTSNALLDACYGTRARRTDRLAWSDDVQPVSPRLWRGVAWALGMELPVVLVLMLGAAVWRMGAAW